MAASSSTSLSNSLSTLSLSPTPPPLPPPTAVNLSVTAVSSSVNSTLTIKQTQITPVIREISPDIHSVLFPSFAYSNTLFFKTPYNVQVIVNPDESEESLIGRFRREVFRANIIQECKRRRYFETNQEMRKRKVRDAARRRARRRPRPPIAKMEQAPKKKVSDEEQDNWGLIDVDVPYCR